jgi:hypothetical protein
MPVLGIDHAAGALAEHPVGPWKTSTTATLAADRTTGRLTSRPHRETRLPRVTQVIEHDTGPRKVLPGGVGALGHHNRLKTRPSRGSYAIV